jgi:hypothetical protein
MGIVLAYVVGALVSWYLAAGMLFSQAQAKFLESANENFREDAGMAIVVGFFAAVAWPLGLPIMYCFTGFAEHGIWKCPPASATMKE